MNTNIIQLTQTLISVPSVPTNTLALNTVLRKSVELLKNYSIQNYSQKNIPSVIVSNLKLAKKYRVILNAHLDIVSGKSDQFKSKVIGNKLIGRGVYDMKGAAAVMIQVFNDLAHQVSYPLGLQLVTDEETGGFHGTKHQVEKGIRADFVISGEPTDFNIKYQAKGIIWAKIHFKGKSAHGAYPWKGDNAIAQANEFMTKLYKLYPIPDTEVWETTVNIARIETENETMNKIPNTCIVSLDIRYVPEDAASVMKHLEKIIPKSATIELIENEPPHMTDKSHPFIQKLQREVMSVTRKQPQLTRAMGASDLRHFSAVGVPGVEFGPVGAGHHTDDEWVSIKSLGEYYQILKRFILAIDNTLS
ncbi:M20/M25/M40 family metallo-hydrolase [Candidatus Roizmanbacteria bacterium]|nr:M20/M25/M40 family metallo-hydrolase [Candidatus Roizmanbacteria bacterium]